MTLYVGDLVEVRSKEEILSSLDNNGRLDELPFMPQMLQFCGQRYKVFKRAHKTCDTVNPVAGRRISDSVHLDLRCDGQAFGGCQAGCLIFWKEAWLKPVVAEAGNAGVAIHSRAEVSTKATFRKEESVWAATHAYDPQATDEKRYFCQATQLPFYTTPLRWWDIRQYLEDYTSGNISFGRLLSGFVYSAYFQLAKRKRLGAGARWIYDEFQAVWDGIPFPRKAGTIPAGEITPTCSLNLKAGELIRVKPYEQILATLDARASNRGMLFDAEMVPYCGKVCRVKTRVERFVDEKTGQLKTLKTPAVILEDVWCQSRYSHCRMFCPRGIYSWWREIWLERVTEST